MSRSSRSSQRASTSRTKNITFRLFCADSHYERSHFFEVPNNLSIQIMGFAMRNELESEPSTSGFATVHIGATDIFIPINVARNMIEDLKGKIDLSKQRHDIHYGSWTRELHKGSVHEHDYFDETNDAWANPHQLNTGRYENTYSQNKAADAVHFRGRL